MTDNKKKKTIIAICSHCEKIREKKGTWKVVDKSIHKDKEIALSHSVCPECRKKHYKGI
ncbi:MAG: hypothetical protein GQ534_12450 [Candidatus Delongbacteria bacterium]|nr:hypothetical protein [Candidatus Delongbacteria bacterium]